MRWGRVIWLSLVLAVLGGQATLPGEKTSATTQPDVSRIVQALGSGDFAVRDEGQKALEQVVYEQRGRLLELAKQATDEEVRARLEQRVVELEEENARHPPPISLRVEDKSLFDVAKGLSRAMGVTIGGSGSQRFTLAGEPLSFWETIEKLEQQHPLRIIPGNPGFSLLDGESPPAERGPVARSGYFRLSLINMSIVRAGGPLRLQLVCQVASDPRLRISLFAVSPMEATDDKGNAWPSARTAQGVASGSRSVLNVADMLYLPEDHGKRLTKVKGELRALVVLREQETVIPHPEAKAGGALTGEGSFSLREFSIAGNRLRIILQGATMDYQIGDVRTRVAPPPRWNVTDASGKSVSEGSGATIGAILPAEAKGPYTLKVFVPSKTEEVVVPFEFKDVPVP